MINRTTLATLLDQLTEAHRVPGAQLALRLGGEVIEVAAGRGVNLDARFPFGSVTKAVTATVIMQLVSDGDLDLDTPVSKCAPELSELDGSPVGQATLRGLLSHTSGLAADHELDDHEPASFRRYTHDLAALPSVADQGTVFSYSNSGYVVAGYVMEAATGMRWWEAVRSFLAEPLRMTLAPAGAPGVVASQVPAHVVTAGRVGRIDTVLPVAWEPAGGIAGTAADLVRLVALHLDADELLDPAVAEHMRECAPGAEPFGLAAGWGLGWARYDDAGRWVGHDGTLTGTTCSLRFEPASGTAVALTTNATSGLALWADLRSSLAELGLEIGDHIVDPPACSSTTDGDEFAGDYANGLTVMRIRTDGPGELRISDGTGFRGVIQPSAGDTVGVRRVDLELPPQAGRFLRDPTSGAITAFQFSGRVFRRIDTSGESRTW